MKYGDLPKRLGIHHVTCDEMLFYQYLPIKLAGDSHPIMEDRLKPFSDLTGVCNCDFIGVFGLKAFVDSYVYITAKHLYVAPGCSFNRPGYHSDGFMTDDINYIWCDKFPTIFNTSQYALTMHHEYSLSEMEAQSLSDKEVRYSDNELLRLNQFSIHKVADVERPSMRTFFKLSFSKDRYNLIGNSHNYLLKYDWEMKPREEIRNHPIK
jgi:hypothetical protein